MCPIPLSPSCPRCTCNLGATLPCYSFCVDYHLNTSATPSKPTDCLYSTQPSLSLSCNKINKQRKPSISGAPKCNNNNIVDTQRILLKCPSSNNYDIVVNVFPFVLFRLSQLLYPSLIAACYQMEENKAILEEEISSKLLVAFLQEACQEEKQRTRKEQGEAKREKSSQRVLDPSSMLQHRFPRAHWEPAITYFSQSSQVAP